MKKKVKDQNQVYLSKAQKCFMERDLQACIENCKKVKDDNKLVAMAKVLHASCLINLDHKFELISEALQLYPECPPINCDIGNYHFTKQNYNEAIKSYTELMNVCPNKTVYECIILTYFITDNFKDAYFYACEGKRKYDTFLINYLLATTIISAPEEVTKEGEFTDVIKYLSKAEEGDIPKYAIIFLKAKYFCLKNDYKSAIDVLTEYFNEGNQNSTLRWMLIECFQLVHYFIGVVDLLFHESEAGDATASKIIEKYSFQDFHIKLLDNTLTENQIDDLSDQITKRIQKVGAEELYSTVSIYREQKEQEIGTTKW